MKNVLFDLGWNSSGESLNDSPSDCYLLNKKQLKKRSLLLPSTNKSMTFSMNP